MYSYCLFQIKLNAFCNNIMIVAVSNLEGRDIVSFSTSSISQKRTKIVLSGKNMSPFQKFLAAYATGLEGRGIISSDKIILVLAKRSL